MYYLYIRTTEANLRFLCLKQFQGKFNLLTRVQVKVKNVAEGNWPTARRNTDILWNVQLFTGRGITAHKQLQLFVQVSIFLGQAGAVMLCCAALNCNIATSVKVK